MNSRPLLSSDEAGTNPDEGWISPAKLVLGFDPLGPPFSFYECENTLDDNVRKKLKERNKIVEKFWNQYMTEYIPTLQKCHKWPQPQANIAINDIVMVKPEAKKLTLKRPYWRKGRVVDIRMGRDGKIRNLKVFLPIRYTKNHKKVLNSIISCPVNDVVHTELKADGDHIMTKKLQGSYEKSQTNNQEGKWSYLKDPKHMGGRAPKKRHRSAQPAARHEERYRKDLTRNQGRAQNAMHQPSSHSL